MLVENKNGKFSKGQNQRESKFLTGHETPASPHRVLVLRASAHTYERFINFPQKDGAQVPKYMEAGDEPGANVSGNSVKHSLMNLEFSQC